MSHDSKHRRSSGTQPITTSFGGRIRFERQSKGWTPAQLAAASGLTTDEIARVESGERSVSLAVAMRLALALDVSVRQLAHAPPDTARMTKRGVG